MARQLEVRVEAEHEYSVVVRPGLLAAVPDLTRKMFPKAKVALLTDHNVRAIYGEALLGRLRAAGVDAEEIVVEPGERSKSLATHESVLTALHHMSFDRRGVLLALGGGVIGDLGGFVAATYMRSVAYVNVPTTLLAQLDSAIGGKVAVNAPWAKNFIGAFHQPRAVWADPCCIATLPERELAAGVAEAIKAAIIGSAPLFELLERERDAIVARRDPEWITELVLEAARVKIDCLAPDPYERDLRRVLNLGHTFAHPLETETGYSELLHGEAVAYGLALAAMIAWRREVLDGHGRDRIFDLLAAYHLPPKIYLAVLERAAERLDVVRLIRARSLNYVLPETIGACRIVPELEHGEVHRAIHELERELELRRRLPAKIEAAPRAAARASESWG